MKFIINKEVIAHDQMLSWAQKVISKNGPEWILQIAQTIIDWNSPKDYMEVKTSGSTGVPKVIKHSKESIKKSALLTGACFELNKGMTSLNCLPANFIAGKMMVIRALVLEMNQLCVPPKIKVALPTVTDLDFVAMTPMQLEVTLDHVPALVDQVKLIILGGAPVSKQLLRRIEDLKTTCYATYGMTETITHIAVQALNGSDKAGHFTCLEGITCIEEKGSLMIRAEHLDQPNWLTNDKVHIIDAYNFKWLGRNDQVINSGGRKIHPEQLEAILDGQVNQPFLVVGAPHVTLGEEVVILIKSDHLSEAQKSSILALFESLPRSERPKRIELINEFKFTATGKRKRKYQLYFPEST